MSGSVNDHGVGVHVLSGAGGIEWMPNTPQLAGMQQQMHSSIAQQISLLQQQQRQNHHQKTAFHREIACNGASNPITQVSQQQVEIRAPHVQPGSGSDARPMPKVVGTRCTNDEEIRSITPYPVLELRELFHIHPQVVESLADECKNMLAREKVVNDQLLRAKADMDSLKSETARIAEA